MAKSKLLAKLELIKKALYVWAVQYHFVIPRDILEMYIRKFRHESDNISPGIIIEDKKGTYGDNLSYYGTEKEVLLFPFTFAKILSIDSEYGNKIVRLEIVNRKSYLEYDLRNNVENRQKFSSI